jgi:nucleolar protein 4
MAMGLGQDGNAAGLSLKGRHILVDLAVDRTTASSLAVQRDADGKPIKKMVGKDKRNLYLKNEGRVSSTADSSDAKEAGTKHGGSWEDLPPSDRAKRERAFAERSTKLRSPLFFINPTRISIRNLAKHINEAQLKRLVFDALKRGLADGLVTPKDAVAHWRAGGELAHGEVMRRATDPNLVTPPLDEKNMKGSVPSVYIDRDVSGGKKTTDAPSRGFGFVEFTYHTHALAVLRQLNNNPEYSAEFAAGGKHASEMAKQKRGKKGKKGKVKADPETGAEFLGEDGKVYVPRLIVEFTVENKVKARQQAEKIAQKKANKIKQRIENKEKQQESSDKKKEKKKGRGALQREKKRARKEAGEDEGDNAKSAEASSKKQKTDESKTAAETAKEKKPKMVKPKKKRKVDKDEEELEDMIRSYKSSFAKGVSVGGGKNKMLAEGDNNETSTEPDRRSREKVAKKRWFE